MSSGSSKPADKATCFQGLIHRLGGFWASQGCVILQPYDMEVGAGTFHPATTLRSLGKSDDVWNCANFANMVSNIILHHNYH